MNQLNVSKRFVVLYQKLTALLLICSFTLSFFSLTLQLALAAQVTIDATVSTASTEHTILGSGTVFVSDQDGYKFYVDSTGACVYSKTTNGGTSWGIANVVDSQTDCFGVTVWYDKWTPGDGGNYIHILTADAGNDDIWYNRLDTTDDSLLLNTLPVSAVINTGQSGTIVAGANAGSITKGTDGTLYMSMNDNTDRYVVECSASCNLSTSWTETGVTPMDAQPDWSLLMPLPAGDILLINRDVSADDMRSKVWNNTTGSWSGAWTAINANAPENATYDPGFAAAVDINTGDVHLAYIDWATTGTLGGTNDDVRTATYSSSVWTNTSDVITNTTRGLTGVSVGMDGNTGDVYVAYTGQTTAGTAATANVYWKRSTDSMSTWGVETGPVNTTADDLYGVDINNFNFERLYVSWYGATSDDMFGDTIADISPIFIVSAAGSQKASVRPQTTDFYIGGKFVFDENVASRNVTSVTINESGTVDASNDLENIKLRYDLDTSAPYDCESESYAGTESQYGGTDIDGFSAANGNSVFTGSVAVSPTQSMCVYVVFDVIKYATEGTTVEIEINNPETDVVVSGGVTAVPAVPQEIADTTLIKPNSDFKIQRGVATITGDTLTLTAGVDYEAPSSAGSAFIRITNTGYTGAGRNTGGGTSNADDTTVYITNPANITSSVTLARGTGAVNNTRVAWEIIEYRGDPGGDNEIIVRHQEAVSYVSGNTTVNGAVTNSVADDTDVVVFITGQRNRSTGSTVYSRGFSTAAWNGASNQAVFTRAATGDIVDVSYALVEFTGANWRTQRVENTYAAAGVTETEPITAVNSLSRTFLHVQKRFSVSTHANFGHEVWLSGIGQVSFLLDAAATTPAGQVAVAWVIENTQTLGTPMDVTRSNGAIASGGVAPQSNLIAVGKTLSDTSVVSLFTTNSSDTTTNTWPEPILSVRLVSATQYELWRSDVAANIDYRTEVVEWPTTQRKFNQNHYRLYVDNNAIKPTDPWPVGGVDLGENTEMTATDNPTAPNDVVRIRMAITVEGSRMALGADSFKLQYAPRVSTCSAVSTWNDVGETGSSTAHWRGINNAPVDGAALSTDPPVGGDLLISVSDVAGTYEEENNSATNPFLVLSGDTVEYDWTVQHTSAAQEKTSYCFRMTEDDGTLFPTYTTYPVLRTVGYEPLVTNWRWYNDETSLTPSVPFAGENIAPSNIANDEALKLRVVLRESSGADGLNVKFALQYSEYADFSQGVFTLTSTSTCQENSLWCFMDGAGADGSLIANSVISSADSCVASVGLGCGTHNESTSTAGVTFDQLALSDTEFEFSITQAGARTNRVYYFRLYNMTYDEAVSVADTFSYPSLVTEGAALSFSTQGISAGQLVAGVTTDATTTASTVPFGVLVFDTPTEAAQRLSIETNATEGYQVLLTSDQLLSNSSGDTVPSVTGTNAVPVSWVTGCSLVATGCFGYHSTDATLDGGSTRFGAFDSYAALEIEPREIMYSSIPVIDTHDVVYKVNVTFDQPVGEYVSNITYIAVPVH